MRKEQLQTFKRNSKHPQESDAQAIYNLVLADDHDYKMTTSKPSETKQSETQSLVQPVCKSPINEFSVIELKTP